MKIITFIEQEEIIRKILKHVGLWEVKSRPPSRAGPPPEQLQIDYTQQAFYLPHDITAVIRDLPAGFRIPEPVLTNNYYISVWKVVDH